MNNKKYKTTMGTIVALMALSGGLFVYENVIKENNEQANKTVIYVAKEDIQAKTAVKADMFTPLEIDNTSVLTSYVTNLDDVLGKELQGGLLKGEPLTQQRLVDSETKKEGEYVINLEPAFESFGVVKNDNIRAYVQYENRDTGTIHTELLFEDKKVFAIGGEDGVLLKGNEEKIDMKSYQIHVTKEELEVYLEALALGNILIVKSDELDIKETETSEEKFNPTSEDAKNAVKPSSEEDNEGQAIMTYTVKDGDTLDSLSLKFKTKPETIRALNGDKDEFEAGEMIQVPAN